MGFFYNDTRPEKRRDTAPAKVRRLEDIPVAILREQSCNVCPRNDDPELRSPKMRPSGPRNAPIYLLGSSPSKEDDRSDTHWQDDLMREVVREFGSKFMHDNVRSNYTVQCMGEEHVAVTECCRGRIERDIEETRPALVVVVGDVPLKWATGVSGTAPQFRGRLFACAFGSHVCHVFVCVAPNFVRSFKSRNAGQYNDGHLVQTSSRFALAFKHDIQWIKDNHDRLPIPTYYRAPYDKGIELLTGDQPGDIHRLEKRLREIARKPRQALDLETTGLRPYMQRHPYIVTAAVGTFNDVLAFPLRISSAGAEEGWGTTAREQRAMELFAEWLQYSGRKACHNLAFEMEWVEHEFGPEVLRRTEWDDTMAMAYVTDGRSGTKGMDIQTRMHFGFALKDQSPVNVSLEQWWLKYPLKTILRYNGMDAKWCDALRGVGWNLMNEKEFKFYEQRVRLAPTLVLTEAPGLFIDLDYAAKLDAEMVDHMRDVERRLSKCREVQEYERRHGRFEPTNPDHVLRLMRDMLKRPECKREDRDGSISYSTDEEVLSAIPSRAVPSAPLILEHREVAKIHGTYVKPALQKKWVCRDGLVRGKYNALQVVTSRLSAEDPNVTNWPKRKHREVRGMIRARKGRWLVPFDYGQIQFRIVGMASEDENLVRYCWTGYDVHKAWASRCLEIYPEVQDWIVRDFKDTLDAIRAQDPKSYDEDAAILKTLRQEFKNKWVFPQLFGSTTHSCAVALHLPDDVADDLGEEFWDEFRDVKKWQENLVRFYEKHLYVETLGGFRRRGVMSINELINHPIQGTEAEIVQEAHMVLSEMSELEEDPELQPRINVHDDLTFDIADANLEKKIPLIAREMCRPRFDYINVPLIVEVSMGDRWDNTQEIQKFNSAELFNIPNPYAKENE